MTPATVGRPIATLRAALLTALLLSSLALAAKPPSAPSGKPAQETLTYGDTEILVERTATATADDLQLPFHAGATLREGYTYRLTTKQEGTPLGSYACATLATKDAAEKVAQDYSRKLPGRPQPTTIQDKLGKRIVLAVASQSEVRMVTLVSARGGCLIRLTRAVKQADLPALPQPEFSPSPEPGPRRSPGRGRGGRRAPGRTTPV